MQSIELGNIEIQVDLIDTQKFYESQTEFTCDCPNCINYTENIPVIEKLLDGLDSKLGIDLYKDLGDGPDALMSLENEDHLLHIIPYYIKGKCFIDKVELPKQSQTGKHWSKEKTIDYRISDNLELNISNTEHFKIQNSRKVLNILLVFKTELIKV